MAGVRDQPRRRRRGGWERRSLTRRRYALFTLVGIAGEDDLDAPDLNLKVEAVSKREAPAKGNGASSTGKAETAELEPGQAETAEGAEAESGSSTLRRPHDPFPTARCGAGTARLVMGREFVSRAQR